MPWVKDQLWCGVIEQKETGAAAQQSKGDPKAPKVLLSPARLQQQPCSPTHWLYEAYGGELYPVQLPPDRLNRPGGVVP
jgi:hypothetical protein